MVCLFLLEIKKKNQNGVQWFLDFLNENKLQAGYIRIPLLRTVVKQGFFFCILETNNFNEGTSESTLPMASFEGLNI